MGLLALCAAALVALGVVASSAVAAPESTVSSATAGSVGTGAYTTTLASTGYVASGVSGGYDFPEGDVDGDGVGDNAELAAGGNLTSTTPLGTTDGGRGVPTWQAVVACGSATCADPAELNRRGVPTYLSVLVCGSPTCAIGYEDSDGNGVPDWISYALAGVRDGGIELKTLDVNNDGLTDFSELMNCLIPEDLAYTGGSVLWALILIGALLVLLGILLRKRPGAPTGGGAASLMAGPRHALTSGRRALTALASAMHTGGLRMTRALRRSVAGGALPAAARAALTATLTVAIAIAGVGITPAVASAAQLAADRAEQTLAEVRAAAEPDDAPAGNQDAPTNPEPQGTGEIVPGTESLVVAESLGVTATFSGEELGSPVDVVVTELAETSALVAESETGGVALSAPIDISATDSDGTSVTEFPSTSTVVPGPGTTPNGEKDLKTGVALSIDVDPSAVAGMDTSQLKIYTREGDGEPWVALPSYYDAEAGAVRADSYHLSEFVVIGGKIPADEGPRIVLDPDNDSGWAETPAPYVSELGFNIRLAQGVRTLLEQACLAQVTITREDPAQGMVDPNTRAAIAAAANPDLFATFGFNTNTGQAWGDEGDGGSQVYTYGGAADNALSDVMNSVLPTWTSRPSRIEPPHVDQNIPEVEFAGVPGAKTHIEALFMDHVYDRIVIDNFDAIIGGVATGFKSYLESQGFNCTNPVEGGWPTPPTQEQKDLWRLLGYQNHLIYGAEPVSMSTGNLIETESVFSLSGPGGSALDVDLVYNSQDGRESRVGYSWSFGMGARAQRFSDGTVMVVRNDGASWMFEADGFDGYTSDSDVTDVLTESGDGRLVLTAATGESWLFDASDVDGIGELVRHTDASGHTTTLAYEPTDRYVHRFAPLTSITDSAGQTIAIGNDAQGHITSITHPDGRVWQLGYDANYDLVALTSPDGAVRRFTYDASHRMLTATDGLGVTYLTNEFDDAGRVTRQVDADGYERTFDYSTPGETAYVDQEGRTMTYFFDELFRVTGKTDAAGNTSSYMYDDRSNITSYVDAAGNEWVYDYDDARRVTKTTLPDGSTLAYTYSARGEVASVTDLGGVDGSPRTTAYEIDPLGLVTETTLATGDKLAYTYDAQGNLTSATSAGGAVTTYGYDARGNLTSVTDPNGGVTTTTFDAANRPTSTTDPIGRITRFEWDVLDRLVRRVEPSGAATTFTYDANGSILSMTDATGAVTAYEWDVRLNLISVTAPDGGVTRYDYNAEDELIGMTEPEGGHVVYEVDEVGNTTRAVDPNGGEWKRVYDPLGNLVASVTPEGGLTRYSYDSLSRLTRTVDPLGNATDTEYDFVGQVLGETDGTGQEVTYTYDLLGRVTAVTDQNGATATLEYDADGHPIVITDRRGNASALFYDEAGRLERVVDPRGESQSYGYDLAGQVVSVTDELGRTTTFAYDADGNTSGVTDPLGGLTAFAYDSLGRTTSVTDPNGNASVTRYTPMGQVADSTDPVGNITGYAYDLNGRQVGRTDPRGNATRYDYDPAGQLTSVTEGYQDGAAPSADTNVITEYTYTASGELASIRDANGNETAFAYDLAGRLIRETNPLGDSWDYEYSALGQLTLERDPRGATSRYQYTPGGALASVGYSDGSAATFEYDPNGAMIAMTDSTGSSGWKYDEVGNLTDYIDARGERLRYDYDAASQLTTLTLPTGEEIGYLYDDAGRPVAQQSEWGTLAYEWDPASNLIQTSRSSGLNTLYTYDPAARVTQIAHVTPGDTESPVPDDPESAPTTAQCATACLPLADLLAQRPDPVVDPVAAAGAALVFDYEYDAASNVDSATRTITASTDEERVAPVAAVPASPVPEINGEPVLVEDAREYSYDKLNRLISSTGTVSVSRYEYDPVGNRTESEIATDDGTTEVRAHYNEANQIVDATATADGAVENESYRYDASGNRTQKVVNGETTTYAYTPDNRLAAVSTSDRSATYAYDGLGRRTSATQSTRYGIQTTDVIFDGLAPAQQDNSVSGISTILRDAQGNIAADAGDESTRWALLDRLGSTSAQAVGGSITQLALFEDYGTQTFETDGWGTTTNYTGQTTDPGLGLNTYYARTYDPTTATWLQQDPYRGLLTEPQSLSRYAYVENNPVSTWDVLGFMTADRLEDYAIAHNCEWVSRDECRPKGATPPTAPDPSAETPQATSPQEDDAETQQRHNVDARAWDTFFSVLGAVGAVVNLIRPLLLLFGALGTIILVLGTLAGIASTVYSCVSAIFGAEFGDIFGCALGVLGIALGISTPALLGLIKSGAEAIAIASQGLTAFGIYIDALDQLVGWLLYASA